MSEWQPIETAPKDGTAIYVYGPDLLRELDGHCAVVRWQTISDGSTIPWWTVNDGKFGPYDLRGPAPTLWMPLPGMCDICHKRPSIVKSYRAVVCNECALPDPPEVKD